MSDRTANVAFSVEGADQSRQDIGGVRTALEGFGDAGREVGQKVVDALQNIQDRQELVNKKISEGRVITVRDGGAMAQQFEILKKSIQDAFGTLENAPEAVQTA